MTDKYDPTEWANRKKEQILHAQRLREERKRNEYKEPVNVPLPSQTATTSSKSSIVHEQQQNVLLQSMYYQNKVERDDFLVEMDKNFNKGGSGSGKSSRNQLLQPQQHSSISYNDNNGYSDQFENQMNQQQHNNKAEIYHTPLSKQQYNDLTPNSSSKKNSHKAINKPGWNNDTNVANDEGLVTLGGTNGNYIKIPLMKVDNSSTMPTNAISAGTTRNSFNTTAPTSLIVETAVTAKKDLSLLKSKIKRTHSSGSNTNSNSMNCDDNNLSDSNSNSVGLKSRTANSIVHQLKKEQQQPLQSQSFYEGSSSQPNNGIPPSSRQHQHKFHNSYYAAGGENANINSDIDSENDMGLDYNGNRISSAPIVRNNIQKSNISSDSNGIGFGGDSSNRGMSQHVKQQVKQSRREHPQWNDATETANQDSNNRGTDMAPPLMSSVKQLQQRQLPKNSSSNSNNKDDWSFAATSNKNSGSNVDNGLTSKQQSNKPPSNAKLHMNSMNSNSISSNMMRDSTTAPSPRGNFGAGSLPSGGSKSNQASRGLSNGNKYDEDMPINSKYNPNGVLTEQQQDGGEMRSHGNSNKSSNANKTATSNNNFDGFEDYTANDDDFYGGSNTNKVSQQQPSMQQRQQHPSSKSRVSKNYNMEEPSLTSTTSYVPSNSMSNINNKKTQQQLSKPSFNTNFDNNDDNDGYAHNGVSKYNNKNQISSKNNQAKTRGDYNSSSYNSNNEEEEFGSYSSNKTNSSATARSNAAAGNNSYSSSNNRQQPPPQQNMTAKQKLQQRQQQQQQLHNDNSTGGIEDRPLDVRGNNSSKFNSNAIPNDEAYPAQEEYAVGELIECQSCNRRFNEKAYEKHVKVCEKVFVEKRKAFDMTAQRVADDPEKLNFLKKAQQEEKRKQRQEAIQQQKQQQGSAKASNRFTENTPVNNADEAMPKWKRDRQQFLDAMKAMKDYNKAKASGAPLPPVASAPNPSLIQCPNCGRRFNEAAAERHIPQCKNIIAKPNSLKRGSGLGCSTSTLKSALSNTTGSRR